METYFDINLKFLTKLIDKNVIGAVAITKNKSYKKNNKLSNLYIEKSGLLKFSKLNTNLMNGGIYYFKKNLKLYS